MGAGDEAGDDTAAGNAKGGADTKMDKTIIGSKYVYKEAFLANFGVLDQESALKNTLDIL